MTDPQPPGKKIKSSIKPQPKSNSNSSSSSSNQTTQFTLRHPLWSYIHLRHHHATETENEKDQSSSSPLDAVTAHVQLTSALTRFLGAHGAAIPIDLLQLRNNRDVWIRVPAEDRAAVLAAVGGWVSGGGREKEGWRVMGWSAWSVAAAAGGGSRVGSGGGEAGQDLFM